ncbi:MULTISPECIES: ATP-binding protein [Arthrobacter]|uniref:ATP-binding protein n=1 Tax=Arthrobacter TaxID=1663 RepID=UPI00210394EC|nr:MULTISPECIES: ATP-binding protein [Arthrobacter]MCQ1952553.1 PspC domain-containing protein [Arthrobacter sp. zg-Y238]MCQ1955325.1 PspC domain-containing protein [Arthrobacter jinronghuae]
MREPLVRPRERIIAGVCAGLAAHLGWPVKLTRIVMAVLVLGAGSGFILYGWLWIMVPTQEEQEKKEQVSANPRSIAENYARQLREGAVPTPQPGKTGHREVAAGLALLLVAAAFIAQRLGANLNWGLFVPVAAIAGGAVLAWMQLDESRRAGLMNSAGADRASGLIRLAAGLLLVVAGVLVVVSGAVSWDVLMSGLLASAAVLAGVALVFTPWAIKHWRDLEAERSGRIRQTERAEIAAHLHDSVLQTLALIQKRAGSEQDVIRLARAQERELRQWLYSDRARAEDHLVECMRRIAAEIEDAYGHPIELVAVSDAALDERTEALASATRAAMLNAAQHAGGTVSVYVECRPEQLEVFVRDRGSGFDLDAVPADRIGVRGSIIGRMQRAGGSAAIRSTADGTEVRLVLPLPKGTENGSRDDVPGAANSTGNGSTGNGSPGNGSTADAGAAQKIPSTDNRVSSNGAQPQ